MGVQREREKGKDDSAAGQGTGESGGEPAGFSGHNEESILRADPHAEEEVESILRAHGIRCMYCN